MPAEARVIATEKSEEAERREASSEKPARALRGRLNHEDAWIQRTTFDVVLAPELIRTDVLDAHTFAKILACPNDTVTLPHRPGLREILVESTAIADRLVEIDRGQVNQMFASHGTWAELFRAVLSAAHFEHFRADLLGDVLDVLH